MKIREKDLLALLSKECKPNIYTVFEKKDISSSLDNNTLDENEIDNLMLSLERQGFIKIKYEDDNVYCLSVLKREIEEKKESHKQAPFSYLLFCFFGGFFGSFFGTLIVRLIFNI